MQRRKRLPVLWLVRRGRTATATATEAGGGVRTVLRWRDWERADGRAELRRRVAGPGARGLTCWLCPAHQAARRAPWRRGPLRTYGEAQRGLNRAVGVSDRDEGRPTLRPRRGVQPQVPRPTAATAEPALHEAWKKGPCATRSRPLAATTGRRGHSALRGGGAAMVVAGGCGHRGGAGGAAGAGGVPLALPPASGGPAPRCAPLGLHRAEAARAPAAGAGGGGAGRRGVGGGTQPEGQAERRTPDDADGPAGLLAGAQPSGCVRRGGHGWRAWGPSPWRPSRRRPRRTGRSSRTIQSASSSSVGGTGSMRHAAASHRLPPYDPMCHYHSQSVLVIGQQAGYGLDLQHACRRVDGRDDVVDGGDEHLAGVAAHHVDVVGAG